MGRGAEELENRLPSLAWTFEYDLMVDCLQSLVFLVAPASLKILLQKRYELIVACLFLFGVMGFMFILAPDLVPYSQSFVVPLGRPKHNTDLVHQTFLYLKSKGTRLRRSSKATRFLGYDVMHLPDISGHRLTKPYKSIKSFILAIT